MNLNRSTAGFYQARTRAINAVAKAKQNGDLPPLDGTVVCVDCGLPAQIYEHRSYDDPLAVDPVCQKCNLKRGRATWGGADLEKPTPMLQFVLDSLLETRGRWREIAEKTGVPLRTLQKIGRREIPNPGVIAVEKLAQHFGYRTL